MAQEKGLVPDAVVGMGELHHGNTIQLLPRAPDDLAESSIHRQDAVSPIPVEDTNHGLAENQRQLLLAGA